MNISTLRTILVIFSPENHAVNSAPFVAIRQKSANHVKYLRISWTNLDLLYRFGRRIGGDNYCNILLAVAQRTLLCNQLKLKDGRRHRQKRHLLLASAIVNGLADRTSTFKRLNGNIRATSCTNLVNLRLIISEFTLFKRAIQAAIGEQFDDDLYYSSSWHSETDWKIAILILAE